jgi:hypothetical protein
LLKILHETTADRHPEDDVLVAAWLFRGLPIVTKRTAYGLPLPVMYPASLAVLAGLCPFMSWFAAVKQRSTSRWLS